LFTRIALEVLSHCCLAEYRCQFPSEFPRKLVFAESWCGIRDAY
jgi:hypothetical protein